MSDHSIAVAALIIGAFDTGLSTIALFFLIAIWKDDRAMRIASEESLKAQLEYLGIRRKWYESRDKARKKDANASGDIAKQEGTIRVPDGGGSNAV